MSSILLNIAKTSILFPFQILPNKIPKKTLISSSIKKMSSWSCSTCTFTNPPSQKSRCQICLTSTTHQQQPQSLSPSSSSSTNPKWACATCTFLNPFRSKMCEICGTRASASLIPTLEVDDDELDEAGLGSEIGSVFLPLLRVCDGTKKENGESSNFDGDFVNLGNVGSGGEKGFLTGLRACSNKRKIREDDQGVDGDDFGLVKAADEAVEVKQLSGKAPTVSNSKTWKILSYNVWFREDLEMRNRMKALGNLIVLHSPDVICLQEVTPSFFDIFQRANWWKGYRCSILDETAFPGGYFCMQLSKLPVKSYSSTPFHNSIMGRELCVAEVEVQPNMPLIVATSHLESPCPGPPKWDQMFSKERVEQAKEAVKSLDKSPNVIFCGDMNWDDKLDGSFPSPAGWIDAWTELRPGEVGFTYDTKSNKMLSGNRALQKRLDRFMCKLKDFKVSGIEMIGADAIPELSYVKEKKVKGQVKELVLPVLPSDHYGLLLTICPSDST